MHHQQPLDTVHQLMNASHFVNISLCICVFPYVLVTSGCPGGELRVKMKSVFRSSNCGFEWRPHFLPVQLLQKTTTMIHITLISNSWLNDKIT